MVKRETNGKIYHFNLTRLTVLVDLRVVSALRCLISVQHTHSRAYWPRAPLPKDYIIPRSAIHTNMILWSHKRSSRIGAPSLCNRLINQTKPPSLCCLRACVSVARAKRPFLSFTHTHKLDRRVLWLRVCVLCVGCSRFQFCVTQTNDIYIYFNLTLGKKSRRKYASLWPLSRSTKMRCWRRTHVFPVWWSPSSRSNNNNAKPLAFWTMLSWDPERMRKKR